MRDTIQHSPREIPPFDYAHYSVRVILRDMLDFGVGWFDFDTDSWNTYDENLDIHSISAWWYLPTYSDV